MSDGTIANEAVASTEGQVASGSERWKTTVSLSGASTLFMFASSEEAPLGSAILTLRSKEKTTSSASSVEPSEKTPSLRILHS